MKKNKNGTCMIRHIIDLLNTDDFYKVSEKVDRAKGMYKIPKTFRQVGNILKRIYYGRK